MADAAIGPSRDGGPARWPLSRAGSQVNRTEVSGRHRIRKGRHDMNQAIVPGTVAKNLAGNR
jgi:hypothetical protein